MSADIRPLERSDLPAVAGLLRAHMPAWSGSEELLAATFLDHPWADEELPSLVARSEGGEVTGFMGAQVRRMRLGDREIRGVCSSQLVVDPQIGGAVGALLLRRVLSGKQDVTWSDSATPAVIRVWQTFGGFLDSARASDWMLVIRPVRWLGVLLVAVARRRYLGPELVPVAALPRQALGPRFAKGAFPDRPDDVHSEAVTTAALLEHALSFTRRLRVWVDHDESHLEHLFGVVETFWGPLRRRMVWSGDRVIGWYAYLPRPGGVSRVLHLAASELDAEAVLSELVEDARAQGSAVLSGRAEPHLNRALASRLAVLGLARQPVIHSRDPELAGLLSTEFSLLTRLDGEVLMA